MYVMCMYKNTSVSGSFSYYLKTQENCIYLHKELIWYMYMYIHLYIPAHGKRLKLCVTIFNTPGFHMACNVHFVVKRVS